MMAAADGALDADKVTLFTAPFLPHDDENSFFQPPSLTRHPFLLKMTVIPNL